jgi:hypothetical protein
MKITVVIENPTVDFFAVLAGMGQTAPEKSASALVNEQDDSAPEQDEPYARITSEDFCGVEIGDYVHWRGAKFEFKGVVERLNRDATGDEKAVFVRRDDTHKLVSLTANDLDNHSLTLLS